MLSRPHEPGRDRAALGRLAGWAVRFSPLVEPLEPDALLLDITGCERLFGGEANIARRACEGLARQGFHVRTGIADTVGAAYALASAGEKAVAIVPPGQASAYLAPLPPAALRIDADVAARLAAVGVRTIGDLCMLPRASLPARFGAELVQRLQAALGEVFEGVATHQPDEIVHARLDFEGVVREQPAIQAAVDRLLGDVFGQLRWRGRGLRRLDCVLYGEGVRPMVVSLALTRASCSQAHTARLLEERFERVDVSAGVCGLMLVARETSRWRVAQNDLFEAREPGEEEELGCLIDRLANRLGYPAVLQAQLMDDHQPEFAFRYFSVGASRGTMAAAAVPGVARPVLLYPRPIPIRVIAQVPDGPPTWMIWSGREYVLGLAEGPERLETAWWRGPDVRRDYFRVTAETGERFWVFHAFEDCRWYLHGVFA